MDEVEKLRVLIPHWIEHNVEHADEFREWAVRAGAAQEDLEAAAAALKAVNEHLQVALQKLGGVRA
jgi:hypothetical protein